MGLSAVIKGLIKEYTSSETCALGVLHRALPLSSIGEGLVDYFHKHCNIPYATWKSNKVQFIYVQPQMKAQYRIKYCLWPRNFTERHYELVQTHCSSHCFIFVARCLNFLDTPPKIQNYKNIKTMSSSSTHLPLYYCK